MILYVTFNYLVSTNACYFNQLERMYFFLSFFVQCAELLAAMVSHLGQPTVYLQSIGQVKLFIEWLSLYIA